MWIQSTLGDFSIVKHHSKQEWLIKTRHKEDIKNACNALGYKQLKIIIVDKTADYKYRIIIPYKDFLDFMTILAHQVEYPNFKAHEQTKRTPKRLKALYEVYNALKKP